MRVSDGVKRWRRKCLKSLDFATSHFFQPSVSALRGDPSWGEGKMLQVEQRNLALVELNADLAAQRRDGWLEEMRCSKIERF
ncbi:hypothetical protein EOA33_22255 [Mesorhizobium sp. M4A.F.Ca.ET.050.02.1.1]|nr:hypothetical protein EOA33_22255 [Mesorhizobium sp. M4A.F.Ca.ET.050.02.1.1]